tara:strand:+ start:22768 stop:23379 length:612 start_codon:yes stop_codon:yes gene_type:complete
MSIEYLNHALRTNGLTPTKKLILVILANYADQNGSCFPSYKHIAKMVGLKDQKGIIKVIKEFESLGLLRIEKRKLDNGSYTSNKYHLLMGRGSDTTRVVVQTPDNTKEDTKEIYDQIFEKFWKIYPRKVAKKQAAKIFKKIQEKDHKNLLKGVVLFGEEKKNTDIQYIPHPSTWLNQERWMDYLDKDNSVLKFGKNKLNKLAG